MEILQILVESNYRLLKKAKKEFAQIPCYEYTQDTHGKVREWVKKWRVEELRFILKQDRKDFLNLAHEVAANAEKEFSEFAKVARLLRLNQYEIKKEKELDDETELDADHFGRVLCGE
ncbi:hypothetical protein PENTCL1PPCAC_4808 [Pristionchus entomophagus]|uniref:Uncharacterized protein n=1 Tax=Pristionchus entomophagus TaxID=358040 RepID=A0AAV5SPT2_9BILA|nr:hypothetical protein PENTCL1PPCAC_4808 [Pristionchus entomophagus]